MPSLGGATERLNSEPLGPAETPDVGLPDEFEIVVGWAALEGLGSLL